MRRALASRVRRLKAGPGLPICRTQAAGDGVLPATRSKKRQPLPSFAGDSRVEQPLKDLGSNVNELRAGEDDAEA
jgi:hypothetical protein